MKRSNRVLVGFVSSILLFSCGERMNKIKEIKDGIAATSDLMSGGLEVAKDMNKLSEIQPWDQKDFQNWVPGETFQGMQRTQFEFGVGVAEASVKMLYQTSDGHGKLDIYVADGADSYGGNMLIAQLNMFLNTDISKLSESSKEQVVTKNGVRAFLHADADQTVIETIANERFYVKVIGFGMDEDAVWKAFQALKTNQLK